MFSDWRTVTGLYICGWWGLLSLLDVRGAMSWALYPGKVLISLLLLLSGPAVLYLVDYEFNPCSGDCPMSARLGIALALYQGLTGGFFMATDRAACMVAVALSSLLLKALNRRTTSAWSYLEWASAMGAAVLILLLLGIS